MNLSVILGSVVISTVISSLMLMSKSKKERDLQYITNERKEWREQMRQIASEMQGASYNKTLEITSKLKVRINSFGNEDVSRSYLNDAHIWKVINELDEVRPNEKELRRKQNQIVEYISLLLKFDWERSKEEIRGNCIRNAGWGLLFTAIIVLDISMFEIFGWPTRGEQMYQGILLAGECTLIMLALNASMIYLKKEVLGTVLNRKITDNPNKKP